MPPHPPDPDDGGSLPHHSLAQGAPQRDKVPRQDVMTMPAGRQAEEEGFEPSVPQGGTPVFETGALASQRSAKLKTSAKGGKPLATALARVSRKQAENALSVDPDLDLIIDCWPDLPTEVRTQIIELVRDAPATSTEKLCNPGQQAPAKPTHRPRRPKG